MRMQLNMSEEKGTGSIIAIVVIAVLTFFATSIYVYSRNEQLTLNRFMLGVETKQRAQDGIEIANSYLNDDLTIEDAVLQANGKAVQIFSAAENNERASCTVYAKKKSEAVVVLSVARKKDVSRRAVAYFRKTESGRYLLDHAEN